MMTRLRAHRPGPDGRLASNAGFTLVELMIVG
ncbi:prepilin-type N-terminal cleavage/methylation domain-containing protein, partial [bacterium]|nr:prepilin-type N-terminal cleavage/methylation domain-containing protein [bacterium]